MSSRICAVVLAGGYGTRLQSTWDGPKCLVPVGGRAVLAHQLDWLTRGGVDRIILVLGYKADDVIDWVGAHSAGSAAGPRRWACAGARSTPQINWLVDDVPQGREQAVRAAARTVPDDVLVVVNGDTLVHRPLAPLIMLRDRSPSGVAVMRRYGTCAQGGVFAGVAALPAALALDEPLAFESADVEGVSVLVTDFVDVGTPEGCVRADAIAKWGWDQHEAKHT